MKYNGGYVIASKEFNDFLSRATIQGNNFYSEYFPSNILPVINKPMYAVATMGERSVMMLFTPTIYDGSFGYASIASGYTIIITYEAQQLVYVTVEH